MHVLFWISSLDPSLRPFTADCCQPWRVHSPKYDTRSRKPLPVLYWGFGNWTLQVIRSYNAEKGSSKPPVCTSENKPPQARCENHRCFESLGSSTHCLLGFSWIETSTFLHALSHHSIIELVQSFLLRALVLGLRALTAATTELMYSRSYDKAYVFTNLKLEPTKSDPRPPNVPLLRALWSLLDGIWGLLKGSWGVLD